VQATHTQGICITLEVHAAVKCAITGTSTSPQTYKINHATYLHTWIYRTNSCHVLSLTQHDWPCSPRGSPNTYQVITWKHLFVRNGMINGWEVSIGLPNWNARTYRTSNVLLHAERQSQPNSSDLNRHPQVPQAAYVSIHALEQLRCRLS